MPPTCEETLWEYKEFLQASGRRAPWLRQAHSPKVEQAGFLIPCT